VLRELWQRRAQDQGVPATAQHRRAGKVPANEDRHDHGEGGVQCKNLGARQRKGSKGGGQMQGSEEARFKQE
jgi:hypothetical protein